MLELHDVNCSSMQFKGDGEEHDSLKSMKFHIINDIFLGRNIEWPLEGYVSLPISFRIYFWGGIMTLHISFLRVLEVSHLLPLQDF